jgi:L-seryl-tRNA selenium transferase
VAQAAACLAEAEARPSQRPVFNLSGTVLHTNLGRAILADAAMQEVTNLEYEIESGKRGNRDDHLRGLLIELTGGEDAIAVNNNATAVIMGRAYSVQIVDCDRETGSGALPLSRIPGAASQLASSACAQSNPLLKVLRSACVVLSAYTVSRRFIYIQSGEPRGSL